MFQAMPKVALAPLIIVWFGLGITSKVVNAGLVCFFPLMINTIVGLRSADEDRISLMRSLAASPLQIFAMLRVPNALPYIFAGLEIAMIFALIGAIVGEFVGAQSGLGMLIQSMNFTMDVAGQFSVLLILFRIVDPPTLASFGGVSVDATLSIGIFLGLIAAGGIAYGGYSTMREEGITFGDTADRLSSGGSTPPPPPSSQTPPPPPPQQHQAPPSPPSSPPPPPPPNG